MPDVREAADKLPLKALFTLNQQRAACYSPDSKYLAGVGDQGAIYVWEAATGQPALSLGGHCAGRRKRLLFQSNAGFDKSFEFGGDLRPARGARGCASRRSVRT